MSVIHGHTHQILLNHIGNINFYGLLSTAWPWPYAPEGLPKLTVQMNRADPFNAFDGCGDGHLNVLASGMVDKVYNLWNRNPVTVRAQLSFVERRQGSPAGDDAFQLLRETMMRLSHGLALALSLAAGPALAGERSAAPSVCRPRRMAIWLSVSATAKRRSRSRASSPAIRLTREQGQQIADTLMKEWRSEASRCRMGCRGGRYSNPQPKPLSESGPSGNKDQFQTYGAFTERDQQIWKDSTERLVAEGKRIFHDAKALGGTNAVSCDMCHPDGSNTHPETYPKYPGAIGSRRPAARHDQLVHRESGTRQTLR